MPLMFNSILIDAGLTPCDVRLLRHTDPQAERGRTPYELWRDNRPQFELYQSIQGIGNRGRINAKSWASFVGTPDDETLFVGLYAVGPRRLMEEDTPKPQGGGVDKAGTCDVWELALLPTLADLVGRLVVDWGRGWRTYVQRADLQNKPVLELRTQFREPEFPGFLRFMQPLSRIEGLFPNWVAPLQAARGIYLLTCPKTREQYVGSATGQQGFWGRWLEYARTGHGGNEGLKSRDPSDYQVSILEVAGSSATTDDIIAMEVLWKQKLQSREMGLNRN